MVLGAIALMKLVFQVPFRGGYLLVMLGRRIVRSLRHRHRDVYCHVHQDSGTGATDELFRESAAVELVRRPHSRAGAAGVDAAAYEY